MPTNEILQFGTGGTVEDGDVLDLEVYAADTDRVGGVQPGIARRALFNTAMRQTSLMSAGLATFIANRYEAGVVDDGDLDKIDTGLAAAINALVSAAQPGQATTDAQGVVELATTTEAVAGTDNERAVTPAGVAAVLMAALVQASTAAKGVVELATTTEAVAGTDNERAVTPAGMAAAIDANPGVPTGAVFAFSTSSPPSGFLECDGSTVSRTTYANLFALVGTTFGSGDGSTTFTLPDLRGEFLRGWDNGRGVDSGRGFATTQTDAAQGHRHYTGIPNGVTVGIYSWTTEDVGSTSYFSQAAGGAGIYQALTSLPKTDGSNGTPRTAAETRPRNMALLFCIKY